MTSTGLTSSQMNEWGKKGIPFLFVFDFLLQKPLVMRLDEIDSREILYQLNQKNNLSQTNSFQPEPKPILTLKMPDFDQYSFAFNKVMHHLQRGDSYLLNLTMPVHISSNLGLKEIFLRSKAPFKLWLKDKFTVFSPEPFIRISAGKIYSFPMKGTLDAAIPDAVDTLMNNEKELAEHYTIVDLIRNDLNMVSEEVRVEKFRFVDEITTIRGKLLQTSSLITGRLPENYTERIGDIIITLLPAGSISGAPKKRTVEIILETEQYDRGYYTGVFGIFDGKEVESAVMIRYIEQRPNGLVFKAGGGITVNSKMQEEYEELISKVYLPLEAGA